MECAGIAEAGGVKNVSFSLCKELALAGHSVTLFIPYFKCTSLELIKNQKTTDAGTLNIPMCAKEESVVYKKAVCTQGDFDVVFVHHPFHHIEAFAFFSCPRTINVERKHLIKAVFLCLQA